MKGGDPGIRLIEPATKDDSNYFEWTRIRTLKLKKMNCQIIPVYQIFGSDELSSFSPSLAQRIKDPFVLMNQRDAEIISASDGDIIQLGNRRKEIKSKIKY